VLILAIFVFVSSKDNPNYTSTQHSNATLCLTILNIMIFRLITLHLAQWCYT